MNCTNHPDQPVAAYCQNCGKALCAACVRPVSSNVYCEQCLAEKLGVGSAPLGAAGGPGIPQMPGAPNPGLAALLGVIPGVGAMYNGQYVKAIVHVLVFVVLVSLANSHDIFGIFIAAWFFYQVFDAYHTARARRFGLPVPDPFGLNDLGNRLGLHNAAPYVGVNPATGQPAPGAVPPGAVPYDPFYAPPPPPADATANEGAVPPYGVYPPYTPVDPGVPLDPFMNPGVPVPPPDLQRARREPIGAIVLIGLGMLFLFNTLGLLQFDWFGRGWPLLIIGIGIWMLISRSRGLAGKTGGSQ
jgi:TM2 domain-containing membrane protein YozV